jgi:hypothetical protein
MALVPLRTRLADGSSLFAVPCQARGSPHGQSSNIGLSSRKSLAASSSSALLHFSWGSGCRALAIVRNTLGSNRPSVLRSLWYFLQFASDRSAWSCATSLSPGAAFFLCVHDGVEPRQCFFITPLLLCVAPKLSAAVLAVAPPCSVHPVGSGGSTAAWHRVYQCGAASSATKRCRQAGL